MKIENLLMLNMQMTGFLLIKLLLSETIVTVVSAYVPQQGLGETEKDNFYDTLIDKLAKCNDKESFSFW